MQLARAPEELPTKNAQARRLTLTSLLSGSGFRAAGLRRRRAEFCRRRRLQAHPWLRDQRGLSGLQLPITETEYKGITAAGVR